MLILGVIRNLLTAPVSSALTDSFVLITPCSVPARSQAAAAAAAAAPLGSVGALAEIRG